MTIREDLRGALTNVLSNASNFPERVQTRILGQDMGPLTDKAADAALQVFEQAHTPTDDERMAAHKEAKRRYGRGEQQVRRRVAFEDGAAWAAGFRRTAVPEPSAEPTEAMVEAGAREAFFTDDAGGHIRGGYTWDTIPEIGRQNYRTMVRGVLHAALRAAGVAGQEGEKR